MADLTAPRGFRGVFRTDAEARGAYSESAGIARAIPAAIAVPEDPDDLVTLVRWANEVGASLIPRGSGSSMSGGAVGPGVIVDLSRWSTIGPVDVDRKRVAVGPGAVCQMVDRAARLVGLRLPVSPSSAAFCTIGGMTATNASGAHSLAFGSMRRWVVAVDCVFANGERAMVRRGEAAPEVEAIRQLHERERQPGWKESCRRAVHAGVQKDSSGYALATYAETGDLIDLLVGSEGSLVFFAGVELSLAAVPAATSSVLAAFATLEDAAIAATRARGAGAVACELLDRTFLEIASRGEHPIAVPSATEAVLLVEVEANAPPQAAAIIATISAAFRDAGATHIQTAVDRASEATLWALRHAASPLLAQLDPTLRSMQFIEDGAVPPDRLAEYVHGVRLALDRRHTRGVIFGHAGDAHVHANALVDVSQPGWQATAQALLDDVVSLTASLAGTLSGEHGDGRLRTPLLDRVWPADVRVTFRAVKDCFDPDRVLNPGVKVPGPQADGPSLFAATKYDPHRSRLPEAAERVLSTVDRERGYARFRLDLLEE